MPRPLPIYDLSNSERRRARILAITAVLLLLAGCNIVTSRASVQRDTKSSEPEPPADTGAAIVATAANLPKCSEKWVGVRFYVADEKVFHSCAQERWQTDVQPAAGLNARSAEVPATVGIYKRYRRGVFRATSRCPDGSGGRVTAWRCSETEVCTAAHLLQCAKGGSVNFRLRQVHPISDTTNTVLYPETEFFNQNNPVAKQHSKFNLAKVVVDSFPPQTPIIPLPERAFAAAKHKLKPVLAMGFPLGFADLFSDLGTLHEENFCQRFRNCDKLYFFTTHNSDRGGVGSPLFDLGSGKVIGITTPAPNAEAGMINVTWALDATLLNDF